MSFAKLAQSGLFAAGLSLLSTTANAALFLTIDSYTTDEVTLTISGTLDADTTGDYPGYLGIKNDWSNNIGTPTNWFTSVPTLTANTVTIDGVAAGLFMDEGDDYGYADSIYFYNSNVSLPFVAGTVFDGSITLSGAGIFDLSAQTTLQLVSGYDTSNDDFTRLEAVAAPALPAVPLPAGLPLMAGALGLIGLVARRKRG